MVRSSFSEHKTQSRLIFVFALARKREVALHALASILVRPGIALASTCACSTTGTPTCAHFITASMPLLDSPCPVSAPAAYEDARSAASAVLVLPTGSDTICWWSVLATRSQLCPKPQGTSKCNQLETAGPFSLRQSILPGTRAHVMLTVASIGVSWLEGFEKADVVRCRRRRHPRQATKTAMSKQMERHTCIATNATACPRREPLDEMVFTCDVVLLKTLLLPVLVVVVVLGKLLSTPGALFSYAKAFFADVGALGPGGWSSR
mmetsp:Transcript_4298/g.9262  ORF Transcript_4298/g.9262 Transcript_4298/m.9262 type:complete len:264 (+) Transcript_4298:75-866(+)